MADITGFTGAPWQVTMSRTGDGYVVHLLIAGVMIVLPALEAHKLGSALHAASGIDTEAEDSVTPEELGYPDWYGDTDVLALECVRCGKRVLEGYRRDEQDHSFWCSKKCMAADGHDVTYAYATVTELGDELDG